MTTFLLTSTSCETLATTPCPALASFELMDWSSVTVIFVPSGNEVAARDGATIRHNVAGKHNTASKQLKRIRGFISITSIVELDLFDEDNKQSERIPSIRLATKVREWSARRVPAWKGPNSPGKRIRAIYIPEQVRTARVPLSKEQKRLQRHAREVAEASRFNGQPKHY